MKRPGRIAPTNHWNLCSANNVVFEVTKFADIFRENVGGS